MTTADAETLLESSGRRWSAWCCEDGWLGVLYGPDGETVSYRTWPLGTHEEVMTELGAFVKFLAEVE